LGVEALGDELGGVKFVEPLVDDDLDLRVLEKIVPLG
jgi:hypothetical protein